MATRIKKLLKSILNDDQYNPEVTVWKACLSSGYAVYEDPFTLFGKDWGRGYVLTPRGIAAIS